MNPTLRISLLLFASGSACFAQLEFGRQIKLTDPINYIKFSQTVDMDGDGDLDICTATNYGLQLNWWENDGNGNFFRHNWRPERVLLQVIIGIGDWNKDGRQDLWLQENGDLPTSNGNITYLIALGNSDGSFQEPSVVATNPDDQAPYSESLIADLNGDGLMDIMGYGAVHLAQPDMTYSDSVSLPEDATWGETQGLLLHDYDGDSDLDLFLQPSYRTSNTKLSFFENTGAGLFAQPSVVLTFDTGETAQGIAFLEAEPPESPTKMLLRSEVIETGREKLASYQRGSDGNLIKIAELLLPDQEGEHPVLWNSPQRDPVSSRIFISDILFDVPHAPNGTQSYQSRLYEVDYTESGLILRYLNSHEDISFFSFTAVGDLNNDNFPDLVVPVTWVPGTTGGADDHIVWYAGNSVGSFSEAPVTIIPPNYERNLEEVCDLDGDGDIDLLFRTSSPLGSTFQFQLSAWINGGDGYAFEKREIEDEGIGLSLIAVEDFTSENLPDHAPAPNVTFTLEAGRKDLIVASQRVAGDQLFQMISIAYQNEIGEFIMIPIRPTQSGTTFYYEDWDGDGMKDILIHDTSGNLTWLKRNYDHFNHEELVMNTATASFAQPLSFIDMDMDGDLDIFTIGNLFGFGSSYWIENDGNGEILSVRQLQDGLSFTGLDQDGDGIGEFINFSGEHLRLVSGVTFELTDYSFPFQSVYSGYSFGGHNLDEDGDLDQVYSLPTYGTSSFQRLFWRENNGSNTLAGFGSELPIDPMVGFGLRDQFALCDMDGDGAKDLLVVSSDTALVEWFKITNRKGPHTFSEWMAAQNLTGNSAGPRGDWDHDGHSNWEEFIYGTQVKVPESGELNLPRIEKDSGGINFTYTRRKSSAELNLFYPMERSMKLDGDWEPWNLGAVPTTALGDYEQVRIPITPTEKAEFFRVKVPDIPE